MVRERQADYGFEQKVNDYLSGFKSENPHPQGDDPLDEDALDEYLLERAAQQLRAASERLRRLERELDKG